VFIAGHEQTELLRRLAAYRSMSRALQSFVPTAPKGRRGVISLVSTLPKVKYREQHEEDFERSFEYVQVQRKILKSLAKHDTALDSRTAYQWTLATVPQGKGQPTAHQALRLCYYMRSLGYETFASFGKQYDHIKNTRTVSLRLFVANEDSEKRGMAHDYLYWVQDLDTGEIIYKAYKLRQSTLASELRGNTLHEVDLGPPFNIETFGQQAGQQASLRGGQARAQDDDATLLDCRLTNYENRPRGYITYDHSRETLKRHRCMKQANTKVWLRGGGDMGCMPDFDSDIDPDYEPEFINENMDARHAMLRARVTALVAQRTKLRRAKLCEAEATALYEAIAAHIDGDDILVFYPRASRPRHQWSPYCRRVCPVLYHDFKLTQMQDAAKSHHTRHGRRMAVHRG
jgi:hypothetical protein